MFSILYRTTEEKIGRKFAQYCQQTEANGVLCFPNSEPQNLSAEKRIPGSEGVNGEFCQTYKIGMVLILTQYCGRQKMKRDPACS